MNSQGGEQANRSAIEGVSIVIPTCHNSHFAIKCLEQVCASAERLRGRKEVILGVDRALVSRDPLFALRERYPFVRLAPNPSLPGAPRARMLALSQARFEIILFTDDDCWVPPDWVERMAIGAIELGVFAGGVAAASPSLIWGDLAPKVPRDVGQALWRMEEIIDRYRLEAKDSEGNRRYISFPNLSMRREFLPAVPFDSLFDLSADDMDLGYRLRINGVTIQADSPENPVRTSYPITFWGAVRRKLRHARGIAYVHRRMGASRMRSLESSSLLQTFLRWLIISIRAPLSRRERGVFLALNLAYCAGLSWFIWRLRGVREFAEEDLLLKRIDPPTRPLGADTNENAGDEVKSILLGNSDDKVFNEL